VTDLPRPDQWPVIRQGVDEVEWYYGLVLHWLCLRPAAGLVSRLPDFSERAQKSIYVALLTTLAPLATLVGVFGMAVMSTVVVNVLPMILGVVYISYVAVMLLLTSYRLTVRNIPINQQPAAIFEHEDGERISEAQQRYVEGELTEDELEAELEAGLERGDES